VQCVLTTIAYHTAHSQDDYRTLLGVTPREIYHTLQPHPALSPIPEESNPLTIRDQAANEAAYRQLLFEGVLTHLLPPEDLENPCLKVLVNEIFAEMILGNGVFGKACEGWLIWDGISKALVAAREKSQAVVEKIESPAANRLEQFGLLPTPDDRSQLSMTSKSTDGIAQSISILLWEMLRILFLIFVSLRTAFNVFTESATLPPRSAEDHVLSPTLPSSMENISASVTSTSAQSAKVYHPRPILEMSAFSVPKRLFLLGDRMPWLTSTFSLLQHYLIYGPGQVCNTNGRIDR